MVTYTCYKCGKQEEMDLHVDDHSFPSCPDGCTSSHDKKHTMVTYDHALDLLAQLDREGVDFLTEIDSDLEELDFE